MGTKKVNVLLVVVLLSVCVGTYCETCFPKRIEWMCDTCIRMENAVYNDTCQIKEDTPFILRGARNLYKSVNVCDESFNFCFFPVGPGVSWWTISVYKQKKGKWGMVAKGRVVTDGIYITVDYDSSSNSFVFIPLYPVFNRDAHKIESLTRLESIGELSLADL